MTWYIVLVVGLLDIVLFGKDYISLGNMGYTALPSSYFLKHPYNYFILLHNNNFIYFIYPGIPVS